MLASIAFTLLISSFLPRTYAQTCYQPDGIETQNQKACPGVSDSSPGPCCYYNATSSDIDPCLSNGMCMSSDSGYLYQGACTSKNWLGCKSECLDYYGLDYSVVTPCYTPQIQGLYCCGFINDTRTRDCCSNREGYKYSTNGQIPTFLGPMNASTLSNITATSDETAAGLLETGNSSSAVTSNTTDIPSSADLVSKETVIGVGIALGVLLAIALGIIAWMWILLRRQATVHQPLPQNESYTAESKTWQGYGSTTSPSVSPPVELGGAKSGGLAEVSSERLPVEVPAGRL